MRTRTIRLRPVLVMLVVSYASAASGQIMALHIVSQPTPADVLPGYVANDLLIDFDGQYTGSQTIVELTRGEIYQNTTFGGDTPPNPALFPVDPTIEWDTFLANGGPTAADMIGNVGLGGAAASLDEDFRGGTKRDAAFSDNLIDQSWNPAGDTEILDRSDFMVARITLSDDAQGTFQFRASAGGMAGAGHGRPKVVWPIRNGTIIPEPSTGILLAFGVVGFAVLTRLSGCVFRSTR